MTVAWLTAAAVAAAWGLAYFRAPLWLWTVIAGAALAVATALWPWAASAQVALWVVFAVVAALLNLRPLRRRFLTKPLFASFRRVMPAMSDTEREALEAGTVGWEAELFAGKPRWDRLRNCVACTTTGTSPTSAATCRPRCGASSSNTASSA